MVKYKTLIRRYHGGCLREVGATIEMKKKLKDCPDTLELIDDGTEKLSDARVDKIDKELTPQQRAANTRAANKAAKVAEATKVTEDDTPDFSKESKVETL